MFTDFVRDERPLERLLDKWSGTSRANVGLVRKAHFDAASDDQLLDRLLQDWAHQTAPQLERVGAPQLPERPMRTERRDPDGPGRPPVWRWSARFTLNGNSELLTAWPAGLDRPACGDDLYFLPTPEMVWEMHAEGPVVLIDVLADEDPNGTAMPMGRFTVAAAYLDDAIGAANAQVVAYEANLRAELLAELANQRKYLGSVATQNEQLAELLQVDTPPLDVVEEAPVEEAPKAPGEDGQPIVLGLLVHERTFEDLVAVTRKWGAGVETYPHTFNALGEESLSS